MAVYMIHACEKRMWYVKDYLIPSMLHQGIPEQSIDLICDSSNSGSLKPFISSMCMCANLKVAGIWHIQDDVILCSDFKKRTEELDDGLVSGFASYYDIDARIMNAVNYGKLSAFHKPPQLVTGKVPLSKMWYSFQCIRIPTFIAQEFVCWCDKKSKYIEINSDKGDDFIFRHFLQTEKPGIQAYNVAPNLVNHIDYLIGGSQVHTFRNSNPVSLFWEEPDLIENLKERLIEDGH